MAKIEDDFDSLQVQEEEFPDFDDDHMDYDIEQANIDEDMGAGGQMDTVDSEAMHEPTVQAAPVAQSFLRTRTSAETMNARKMKVDEAEVVRKEAAMDMLGLPKAASGVRRSRYQGLLRQGDRNTKKRARTTANLDAFINVADEVDEADTDKEEEEEAGVAESQPTPAPAAEPTAEAEVDLDDVDMVAARPAPVARPASPPASQQGSQPFFGSPMRSPGGSLPTGAANDLVTEFRGNTMVGSMYLNDIKDGDQPGRVHIFGTGPSVRGGTVPVALELTSVPAFHVYVKLRDTPSLREAQALVVKTWRETTFTYQRPNTTATRSFKFSDTVGDLPTDDAGQGRKTVRLAAVRVYRNMSYVFQDPTVPHEAGTWFRLSINARATGQRHRTNWTPAQRKVIQKDVTDFLAIMAASGGTDVKGRTCPVVAVQGLSFAPYERVQLEMGLMGPRRATFAIGENPGTACVPMAPGDTFSGKCAAYTVLATAVDATPTSPLQVEQVDQTPAPAPSLPTLSGASIEYVSWNEEVPTSPVPGQTIQHHAIVVTAIPEVALDVSVPLRGEVHTRVFTTSPSFIIAADPLMQTAASTKPVMLLNTPLAPKYHAIADNCRRVHVSIDVLPDVFQCFVRAMMALNRSDPDVLIGHDLHRETLPNLLSSVLGHVRGVRDRHGAAPSNEALSNAIVRLGRLGRGSCIAVRQAVDRWDRSAHKTFGMVPMVRAVTAGRLVVSTKAIIKETRFKVSSFELRDIADGDGVLQDGWMATRGATSPAEQHVEWAVDNTVIAAGLQLGANMVPLMHQLATVTGHPLGLVLEGDNRAERIETILNYWFTKEKRYVLPDRKLAEGTRSAGREKAKYEGGMVLEPIKGMHSSAVLYLDFNSLYPSIIIANQLCFVPKPDDAAGPQPVIPRVIGGLVDKRQTVRGRKTKDAKEKKLQNIEQLALKICANSMYGSLGYQQSRYHAEELAANVTRHGREAITVSREVANTASITIHGGGLQATAGTMAEAGSGDAQYFAQVARQWSARPEDQRTFSFEVVYGDTDSVMVKPFPPLLADRTAAPEAQLLDYMALLHLSVELAEAVQAKDECAGLKLGLDGIIGKILLVAKKKYAAQMVDLRGRGLTRKMDFKGLDLVRRDYCPLATSINTRVIDIMFNAPGDVEEDITRLLQAWGGQVAEVAAMVDATGPGTSTSIGAGLVLGHDGQADVGLDALVAPFIMTVQLTRDLDKYPDKNPPIHAKVARAVNKRLAAEHLAPKYKSGDIVRFIRIRPIAETQGPNMDTTDVKKELKPAVDKTPAWDVDEFCAAPLDARPGIDLGYYLTNQAHPTLQRLIVDNGVCMDSVTLARTIGVQNVAMFEKRDAATATDATSFADVPPFMLRCPNPRCRARWPVPSIVDKSNPLFYPPDSTTHHCLSSKIDIEKLARPTRRCPNCNGAEIPMASVVNQFGAFVRRLVDIHSAGYLTCTDHTCDFSISKMESKVTDAGGPSLTSTLATGSRTDIAGLAGHEVYCKARQVGVSDAGAATRCLQPNCMGERRPLASGLFVATTLQFYEDFFLGAPKLFPDGVAPPPVEFHRLATIAARLRQRVRVTKVSVASRLDGQAEVAAITRQMAQLPALTPDHMPNVGIVVRQTTADLPNQRCYLGLVGLSRPLAHMLDAVR